MNVSIGKSSLARAAVAANTRPAAETESAEGLYRFEQAAVEAIRAPRGKKLPAQADEALNASVCALGILEPVLLAQTGESERILLDGGRRLAAAKAAGLTTVPAMVTVMTADKANSVYKELHRFSALQAVKTEEAAPPRAVRQNMPDWML